MPRNLSNLNNKSIEELTEMLNIKEPTEQEIKDEMIKRNLIIKLRCKKYYEENKEKILERKEKRCKEKPEYYREKNISYMEKFRNKNNFKIDCGCGSKYVKANQYKHFVTKKHLNFLETKKEPENEIVESIAL